MRKNGLAETRPGPTEPKKMTEELRRREALLAETQRLSHTGSFGWSSKSGELFWSEETFRIFEHDPTTRPSIEHVLQRVHPDDKAMVQEVIDRAIADHRDFDLVHRLLMPNGATKYVRVVAHAVKGGADTGEFVGAIMDVSSARVAEATLRQDKMELRLLVDAVPHHLFVLEPDGRFLYSNQRDREYTGRSLEEMRAPDFLSKVIYPDDLRQLLKDRAIAIASGLSWESEARLLGRDGTYRWFLFRINPMRDEDGRIIRWYGTRTDIEDRKRAEDALKRSEERWRNVFESNPTMYFMISAQGTVLAVNPYGAEHLGYAIDELIGRSFLETFFEPDRPGAQESIAKCLSSMDQSMSWELRKARKDGSLIWARETGRAVFRDNERMVLIVCEDVTERKHAEERIREQELELRQMMDLTPQHVAVLGAGGERLYLNQAGLEYFGLTLEEWRAEGLDPRIHPDDVEQTMAEWRRRLEEGTPGEREVRLRRKDGLFRWFLFRVHALRSEQGQITRWYSSAVDIEVRKQSEDRLKNENVALREEVDRVSMFEEIIGTSEAVQRVLARVSKVAPTDSTVLITGETGTGKELIARALHKRSPRAHGPFVSVNCSAIPTTLISSELFGHEKGAFTGAVQRRLGRFELAENGTIFLDEVGELPPETQVSLLRVLQERELERVGGSQTIPINVRVIAATNRDLTDAIRSHKFRSDLYYRLNVFPIEVPPLRERRKDLPLLLEYFIHRHAQLTGKRIASIDKESLEILESYPWPGNIRELQNVIERSVILCEGDVFSVDRSWLSHRPSTIATRELTRPRPHEERELIETALVETRGRISGPNGAAVRLGIPSTTLESKIKALSIDKHRFKSPN